MESKSGSRKLTLVDTIIRVFTALKATIKLQVELPNLNISLGK